MNKIRKLQATFTTTTTSTSTTTSLVILLFGTGVYCCWRLPTIWQGLYLITKFNYLYEKFLFCDRSDVQLQASLPQAHSHFAPLVSSTPLSYVPVTDVREGYTSESSQA